MLLVNIVVVIVVVVIASPLSGIMVVKSTLYFERMASAF